MDKVNNKEVAKKLFLDDYRIPMDCIGYMHKEIGARNPIYLDKDWVIIRNYRDFVNYITKNGLPDLISFDHDLADGHYHANMQEGILNYDAESFNEDCNKTGFHCAKWLIDYCIENDAILPEYLVHSMNPVGKDNIKSLLNGFNRHRHTK